MKRNILARYGLLLPLLILGCGIGSIPGLSLLSTPTPTSSVTPSPTLTSTPTNTPTPTITPEPTSPAQAADAAYAELLEQVKKGDPDFDFTNLRMTFTQTSDYDPYNFDKAALKDSMYIAYYDDKDYELALELAKQILEKNYLIPDAHLIAFRSYTELGKTEEADYHSYFLNGLIESIFDSGDGQSPETAFVVIQLEEEYLILGVLGVQDSEQGLIEESGIPYDVFEGKDGKTGNDVTLYFDVSLPYEWLENSLTP